MSNNSTEQGIKEFRKAIISRQISTICFILIPADIALFSGLQAYYIGILIGICLFVAGVVFGQQYKCPFCGQVFDERNNPKSMKRCFKCNKELWADDNDHI